MFPDLRPGECQTPQRSLPARNSAEDCETRGPADFQKPTMDISTRLRSGSQCENQSDLVWGQFTRFHQVLRMAAVLTGLEPARLFHMGHIESKSQRYPTQKLGLTQMRCSARVE